MGEGMTSEEQQELFNERAGIREFDGGLQRDEAERLAHEDVRKDLFNSEVASVVRKYREEFAKNGPEKAKQKIQSFLLQIEKHRGSDAASRLRTAALSVLGFRG